MGLWPWTKRVKAAARSVVRVIRAKFDSAQTTPDNMRHWANADFLSANAAARPEVRRVMRNRARYTGLRNQLTARPPAQSPRHVRRCRQPRLGGSTACRFFLEFS